MNLGQVRDAENVYISLISYISLSSKSTLIFKPICEQLVLAINFIVTIIAFQNVCLHSIRPV